MDLNRRHGRKDAHAAKLAITSGVTGKRAGNLKRKAETQPRVSEGLSPGKRLQGEACNASVSLELRSDLLWLLNDSAAGFLTRFSSKL